MIKADIIFTNTQDDDFCGMEVRDISSFIKNKGRYVEIVKIESLSATNPGQGEGSEFLKDFCGRYEDRIIILRAGALISMYKEEPTEEENKQILNKLTRFYERCGFVNVNHLFGGFDNCITFVHDNKAFQEIL